MYVCMFLLDLFVDRFDTYVQCGGYVDMYMCMYVCTYVCMLLCDIFPDRLDTYSVGVMLMQMSVPELRPNK